MSDDSILVLQDTTHRFIELIVTDAILSLLLYGAVELQLFPHTMEYFFLFSVLAAAAFWIINFAILRRMYRSAENTKKYYIVAFTAYFFFMLVSVIVYKLYPTVGYTAVFCITKFMRYVGLKFNTVTSSIIFHIIMMLITVAATWGIESPEKRRQRQQEEKQWKTENALDRETYVQAERDEWTGTEDYVRPGRQKREKDTNAMTRDNYVQAEREEWSGTEDYVRPGRQKREKDANVMTRDNYVQAEREEWSGTEDYVRPGQRTREKDANMMTHDNYESAKKEEWSGEEDYVASGPDKSVFIKRGPFSWLRSLNKDNK